MFNVPFYLGGTSMLIVVVVVMDFMAQVQSHLMSHQYEGVMKKANLTNIGPAGRFARSLGDRNESPSFGQENLSQLQSGSS